MTKKINLDNELRLMVALDLTAMDPILLAYVSYLCSVWNIEHLYFTHNIKQYKLSDLYDEFLEEGITIEDIVDRGLQKTIDKHYTASVPHTVLITSDDYTESILSHLAKEYDIDIVVLGNKDELQGTGALNQKLVRMLHTHVLLVPEAARHKMESVVVPTDFSPGSAKCFNVAQSLVERSGGNIEGLHVYSIPSVFFPIHQYRKSNWQNQRTLKRSRQALQKKI